MGDADAFEAITAVNDGPMPRDALPTDAIEPVILIEPVGVMKPVPITMTSADVDSAAAPHEPVAAGAAPPRERVIAGAAPPHELVAAGAAPPHATAATDAPAQHETATTEMPALSVEALLAAARPVTETPAPGIDSISPDAPLDAVAAAVDDELAVPEEVEEPRDAVYGDKIARQRGLSPIVHPYVRDAEAPSRLWPRLSIALSLICLAVAVGAVLWARAEVRQARAAHFAPPPAPPVPAAPPSAAPLAVAPTSQAPAVAPTEAPAPSEAPAPTEPVAEATPAPAVEGAVEATDEEPAMTELTVRSRPAGATVTYNGEVLGKTPLVAKVPRDEPGILKFRAPGMEPDARRIVPKQAEKTVRITLKRRH